jgi:GH43 family beta-xylosidase
MVGNTKPIVLQRADPWCYMHTDGYYYFTGSVPEYDRIELRRAKSIKELSDGETNVIWNKHASGVMSHNIWAPELHHINGKWYIYFAAGRAEEHFHIECFVLECADADPMTGKWVEKGRVNTGWDTFALDMTSFIHKGEQYVIWAQQPPNDPTINSNLYIAKCENPWTLSTKAVCISTPEYDWEMHRFKVNEGAAVLNRNGKIFVTYSASDTGAAYCMGMLWTDENADLLDPVSWRKSDTPVLQTCEKSKRFGPGHNSFTVGWGEDILIYHCRPYAEIAGDPLDDPNRHAMAAAFTYDKNGFPVFDACSSQNYL